MPYKNKEDRNANERKRRAAGLIKYSHSWYEQNKERLKKTQQERYTKKRVFLDSFKQAPCLDCKKIYPTYVMDFDHVRGEKKFSLAKIMSTGAGLTADTIKKIKEEIDKCEVVCSNCHRERTYGVK